MRPASSPSIWPSPVDLSRGLSGLGRVVSYAVLTAYALASLVPMYWMFVSALKPVGVLIQIPPEWWPRHITWSNFAELLQTVGLGRWILNSAIVACTLTVSNVLLGAMAGFAFAKLSFPGRDGIFWVLLATMTIPGMVTFIPLYLLMLRWHWVNTYYALIVPGLVHTWAIFLLKQYMQSLPSSLLDAARMDACSAWRMFWKVVVPMSVPALATVAIFTFVGDWNDFFWPLLVTSTSNMETLQVGLASFRYQYSADYGAMLAGAVISALPMIVLFLSLQRYFLKGLTVGSLKG